MLRQSSAKYNDILVGYGVKYVLCVFSSDSFWTQEEGQTGFFIYLLYAVRALIFLARRIQPFLSLVDREVEFSVRPTLMHTKNLYENGPNPFFSGFFSLMGTRMVQIRMAKSV